MSPPTAANGAPAMHAAEAGRWANVATDVASNATPDTAATAAASAASAHAAAATANHATDSRHAALNAAATISPKVWAGTIAGAISFSFWTIATATFWKNTFSSGTIAALIASTTAIVAAAAAYLKTDPLRSGE